MIPLLPLLVSSIALVAPGPSVPSVPYNWKSVQMVGGGFVDGVVFHPTAKGLRYCRTDIGGAYRWDDRAKRYMPIMDWVPFPDLNFMGVESIALDPHDPSRLYLACGTYTNPTTPNGAILRSDDRGRTFQVTRVPFKFGGNENGRGNGERLAVDPNDGRVLFLGTRHDGLWMSPDRAASWKKVDAFPEQPAAGGVGIVSVVFDARSGRSGERSSVLYAAVSKPGPDTIYRSTDSGATWYPVPGGPTGLRPSHMVPTPSGAMYLSFGSSAGPSAMRDGGVWKLDTNSLAWTDITPDKPGNGRQFGYGAVSVQSNDPNVLIASTFNHPGGEQIFRSIDEGKSWKAILGDRAIYDYSIAPYVAKTPIHWLLDVKIDPCDPNHATFTTGYGGYETFDLTDADRGRPTHWSVMTKGVEETVPLELLSPNSGPHLISAIGDYGGFVHWNLDASPPQGNYDHPHFGNCTGVACGGNAPNVVVRVGRASGNRGGGNIGYSLDSGKTWQTTPATPRPGSNSGRIAVSSDGSTWIWTVSGGSYWTRDKGATWTQSTGLPTNPSRVIADPVDPNRFYSMSLFAGKLFVSDDGGATFKTQDFTLPGGPPKRGGDRFDDRGGQDQLYAAPGRRGDLWIAAFDGLYHSTDMGSTFAKIDGVEQIHAFGFGKGLTADPALYLVGTVRGVRGVFRSTDLGVNWAKINDDAHQWGLVLQIAGDPRIFGRVYVGCHGRGVFYGDAK